MNNKKIGTEFEKEMCAELVKKHYWVHFISPDNSGKQPFDIIAVKSGVAFALDCKTCVKNVFSIDRLEDNQILAFEKWTECGNTPPMVAVKHEDVIYMVDYVTLKKAGKVSLKEGEVGVRCWK